MCKHSYALSLRVALSFSRLVKMFKCMLPLVDDEWSAPINGISVIAPLVVGEIFINALLTGEPMGICESIGKHRSFFE